MESDVRKRCKTWEEPHEFGTIDDLIKSADDPREIKYVLACNLSTRSLPRGLE